MILNHVAARSPRGMTRKEFIPNMSGNFLIFNHVTGEVSGTAPTTRGFQGTELDPTYPVEIDFEADNGKTYEINNWFSFTASDIYSILSSNYPTFHNLLDQSGLARPKEGRYTFISDNEFYTVFMPADSILAARVDSGDFSGLTQDELRNVLLLHFVRGELIFTDGSASPGYYTTERIDEKSTPYSTINTTIYITPGLDIITLNGNVAMNDLVIPESGAATNKLAGVSEYDPDQAFQSMYNNGVFHEIGRVLMVEELDTE